MKSKGVSGYAVELSQASFGETPKALDAIDVVLAHGKLMSLVVQPSEWMTDSRLIRPKMALRSVFRRQSGTIWV